MNDVQSMIRKGIHKEKDVAIDSAQDPLIVILMTLALIF